MAIPSLSGNVLKPSAGIEQIFSPIAGAKDIAKDFSNLQRKFQEIGTMNQDMKSGSLVPWKDSKSVFFPYIAIKPDRWNQLWPYRLIVYDISRNRIVNGNPSIKVETFKDKYKTILNFEPLGYQWIFTLPITPQQLNISDQYAINTTATLRGVLEEHNGVKFKTISASGTMGVWPFRASIENPSPNPLLQSLFGGTIEALGNVKEQFSAIKNIATSGHPASKPTTKNPEDSGSGPISTGYYHAMALQQFLEQYAEAKKRPECASWRLVFDIPKQNQSLVVTPMQFVWQQNVSKPTQINYTFQLKAWRRINLKEAATPISPVPNKITPNALQNFLNMVTQARRATSSIINLIRAVRSDVEKPLNILRQTALFIKDLAGIPATFADMASQTQKDYANFAKDYLSQADLLNATSDPKIRKSIELIRPRRILYEGLGSNFVASGQLGKKTSQNQSIDPAENIFNDPNSNFELLDLVSLDSLPLNSAQQEVVNQTIEEARQITVDDLRSFRSTILELVTQLSSNFGSGDTFYSEIYNRPMPTSRITPMTLDEYDILKSLYDVIQVYDNLTATTEIDDAKKQSSMEYVAGLAERADISFEVPGSKIIVPVPFGLTIEAIAARYLGDAQRWLEIVTLNNLQDPYIDENGFQRYLLSNAIGRHITIDDIEDLYIGQRVVLHSSTQVPSARKILNIDRLSDTSYLLTLDGEADLDNFIFADNAYIQAYLPGTINSQQKIFIPSDLPVPEDPNIMIPASVSSDSLVGLSKVDWLMTDSGDVASNSFGDFRLSAGMTNLIQAIKIKLSTPKGKLITHPYFGLGIKPGMMSSDIDVQEIYNSINKLISDDPRFDGLSTLQISINGPTLSINMAIMLAGQNGVFPLTFEMAA